MNLENQIKYQTLDDLPLFLTVSDVSNITGLGINNAYELVHDKTFPSKKVGNRWIIPKVGFIEWMKDPKRKEN